MPIFSSNTYGYGVSKIDSFNEFKDFGFIPIKSNILPQYDGSATQSINKVKAQPDFKSSDIDKSDTSTKTVPSSVGVKILSPVSGKDVPVGNLTIFGVSTDNDKSDCTVLVDWNDEKPFQEAKAAGPYGNGDYSSWTFTYSPSYHTIQNGINDLTSKLECLENSKVTTKWHSINVTGVVTNDPISTSVLHDPLGVLPQLKSLSTSPSGSTQIISSNQTTLSPTKLLTHMELSKDLMFPGEAQNFTVKISDSKTLQDVGGANVAVKIMQANIMVNEYNGSSDSSGEYSNSWNIMPSTPSGKYDVLVSASAEGYQPALLTGSFVVQKQLSVEASLLKRLVAPGDEQTIDVKVIDANTKEIVPGADVMAKIGQKNGYNGTSDTSGAYSHTWNITSDTASGKYDVLVSASADGYQPASLTGSFEVQKQLLVEASLSKELVVPGDEQTIDVKVVDANTKEIVSGANVLGKIGGKKFSASTDDSGSIDYTWDTPPTSGGNAYKVVLDVSHDGYPKVTKTTSFKMDKPQNLLEPPISNYQNNIVKVNDKDLSDSQEESQNKLQECAGMLSSIDCSAEVYDKPIPNPTTDDKPIPNPTTDDKPILNGNIDIENSTPEENRNANPDYDFLASVDN
ncbi:MAG: carboxypeptidase regulatory-like domain-containing protein [Nitrososphaerota archaeon]